MEPIEQLSYILPAPSIGSPRVANTDQRRDGDMFTAPTTAPADAGLLEYLVAFSGRTF